MQLQDGAGIDKGGLTKGLWQLGYDVDPEEVERLIRQLDITKSGQLHRAELAASIVDWRALQVDFPGHPSTSELLLFSLFKSVWKCISLSSRSVQQSALFFKSTRLCSCPFSLSCGRCS